MAVPAAAVVDASLAVIELGAETEKVRGEAKVPCTDPHVADTLADCPEPKVTLVGVAIRVQLAGAVTTTVMDAV